MLEGQDDQAVSKNADDNGRHTVEQVGGIANDEGGGAAAEFREIDGAEETDRNADEGSEQKQLAAANNGVGHAAASFADRRGQLGKEVPTDRCSAVIDEVAEDQEEHRNGNQGAHAGHGEHETAHKLAPAQPRAHAFPIPAPRWEVATISRRASPLRTKVRRKSTSPNSMRD